MQVRRPVCLSAIAALVMAPLAGCPGLENLFPIAGNGTIVVRRIVKQNPANVTTDITLPVSPDFTDGLGFKWDLHDEGVVIDGGNADFPDAFDQIMILETFVEGTQEREFDPGTDQAKLEDGREVVIGPIPWDRGLVITRKIFISADKGFCRWLDIFDNPTATDITVESENRGNLGSDENNNNVFVSSNGNTTLEEGDVWFINGQQFATDPTVAAFFCGIKDTEKEQDTIKLDYGRKQVVVAGTRNILATYWFQRAPNRSSSVDLLTQEVGIVADLTALMKSLETFPAVDASFLVGMTEDEVNDLRNCGGNVVAEGGNGSVTANQAVTVTNKNNGSTRSGKSTAAGAFGPLNVKGHAGDMIDIAVNGTTVATKVVP